MLATLMANMLLMSAALNTGHIGDISRADILLAVTAAGFTEDIPNGRRHLAQTQLPASFSIGAPSDEFARGFAADIAHKIQVPEEDVTVAFVLSEVEAGSEQFSVLFSVHLDRCNLCDIDSSSLSSDNTRSTSSDAASHSSALSNSASSEAAAARKLLASPSTSTGSSSAATNSAPTSSACSIQGYYEFRGYQFDWIIRQDDLSAPTSGACAPAVSSSGSSSSSAGSTGSSSE